MEELEANYLIPQPPPQLENYKGDQCSIFLVANMCAKAKQPRLLEHDRPKGPKHVPREVNESCSVEFQPIDEEPELEAKITELLTLVNKLSQDKLQIIKELQDRRYARRDIIFALQELNYSEKRRRGFMAQNWKENDIFERFLDKPGFANNPREEKPAKTWLPREELVRHKLHFRVLHGTASLAEEKQLLRETRASKHYKDVNSCLSSLDQELEDSYYRQIRLEKTHRKAAEDRLGEIMTWPRKPTVGEAIVLGKISNSLSSNKKAVRDLVKVLSTELDELRKKKPRAGPKVGHLKGELKTVEKEIKDLKNQVADIVERKKEAYQCFLQLMKNH